VTRNTITCGQCGECCEGAPCHVAGDMAEAHGLSWHEESGEPCPFLLPRDAQGRRLCDVYDEIVCIPGANDPGMTFGPGCCLATAETGITAAERAAGQLDLFEDIL